MTKTIFRAACSVLLNSFLWFVLYLAFTSLLLFVLASIPFLIRIVDLISQIALFDHLAYTLLMGIPAIIPAIIGKLIMNGTPANAQKYTRIITLVIISVAVLCFFTLNLFEKIQGIIGLVVVFSLFGKES